MLLTEEELKATEFKLSIRHSIARSIRNPINGSIWRSIENSIIFFIYILIMNSVNLSICRRLKNATH